MKPVLLYGLLASLFLCFGSCKNTDDEFLPDDVLPPVKEGYVRMQITVPGLAPVSTYALSESDEYRVSEVDVLVFDAAGKYLCRAYAQGQDIITDSSDSNKKTFDVYLDGAGYATGACVMVVANAHDAVEAVNTASPFDATTTREAVMQSVRFDSPGKWNVPEPPATNLTPFPMWGGLSSVDLSNTASVPVPSIPLIRSVARIDVGVNFPDDVIDGTETGRGLGTTFTLESIELHNSLDGGLVAPNGGIYPASAPSIPTTPAPGINDSPVPSYSAAPATATADGFSPDRYSCTGAIYMAEQFAEPAVDGGGPAKRPCLVIGGRYGSSTADITYYRLDFVSGSYPSQTFLDVLRNHRYRFNITKVDGPGYDTPEEAFDAAPVNLTVSLTATDESLASYVYDGQYALGVSQDSYTFDNTDRTGNTLQVSTTYEKGYTAVSSNTGWLVITGGASTSTANSPGSPTTLTFRVVGGVSSARTDTIIITAGRLKKKVLVNRKNSADAFSVTDPLSEYPYNTTAPQTLTVTSSYDWYVKITADPDGIIKSFTHSGTGSGFFEFTLNESSLCVSSKPATFAFFSPTGEFTELPKSFQMGPAPFPAYTPNPTPSTHNGWADSNVYWDGTKLTFNGAGNRNYQGVLFKWGSLVGMDPITAWGTNVNVYVYNFNNSNKWEQLKVSAAGYASWTTIPYFDTPNSIPADRAQAYLTAIGHNPANRKGDICRFLTDLGHAPEYDKGTRWRMPTSNEFGGNTDYSGWNSEGSSTTLNVSGTGAIAQGRTKIKHNGVDIPVALQPRFPASGLRESDNGAIRTSGGYYWSSSPANANGYDIDIYDNGTYAPDNSTRTFGQSVRCVRE